jgi:hypothetical protein
MRSNRCVTYAAERTHTGSVVLLQNQAILTSAGWLSYRHGAGRFASG